MTQFIAIFALLRVVWNRTYISPRYACNWSVKESRRKEGKHFLCLENIEIIIILMLIITIVTFTEHLTPAV